MQVELNENDIRFLLSILANFPINARNADEAAQLINRMNAVAARLRLALGPAPAPENRTPEKVVRPA